VAIANYGIPAVFSFSISFHIRVIWILVASKIPISGCGYVHDSMPADSVSQTGLIMIVERSIGPTEVLGQVHIRGNLPKQDLGQMLNIEVYYYSSIYTMN
jgi:hypothetical protein